MDLKKLLVSENVLEKIEAICSRRFHNENEADECFVFVLDALKEDDYRRLRSFKGKSSLTTYLYTLVNALATDYARKKYGRRRVPKEVSKLGNWADAIYRLICWKNYSYREAYETVLADGSFKGTFSEFLTRTDPIRLAPCPENPRFVPIGDDYVQDSVKNTSDPSSNPLDRLVNALDTEKTMVAVRVIRDVTAELSDEDQLLVRLVYASDHSSAAAARVIGIKTSTARARLKSIVIKYRARFLEKGIREM